MAIAVVVLAHEHTRRLGPLVERVDADNLAMRHERLVLLAAEQGAQVVVQPASAVVAFIDDDSLAVAVLVAEQFTIDGAERRAVHLLDMDIGQLAAREAVHQSTVAVHPALVEQFILLTLADGLDGDIRTLLGRRVIDGDMDGLAGLAIKHPIVILAGQNVVAVNFLDDTAGGDTCLLHVKGATLDDLLDTKAVALIGIVQEEAKSSGLEARTRGAVAGTRVGTVQFAQHLAQHVAEIVVVIDVGQEALVILAVAFPVHAMDVLDVEFVLDLLPDVVEDVLAFLIGTVVEVGLKADGLGLAFAQVNLLDAVARADKEVLAVLVQFHGTTAHALEHDFGLVLTQVMFPQVHAALEGCLIIERVTAVGQDIIAQAGRVHGQARNAVTAVLQVKLQCRHGRLFVGRGLFLFIVFLFVSLVVLFLLGFFLLLFLGLFTQHLLLLGHPEALVGV